MKIRRLRYDETRAEPTNSGVCSARGQRRRSGRTNPFLHAFGLPEGSSAWSRNDPVPGTCTVGKRSCPTIASQSAPRIGRTDVVACFFASMVPHCGSVADCAAARARRSVQRPTASAWQSAVPAAQTANSSTANERRRAGTSRISEDGDTEHFRRTTLPAAVRADAGSDRAPCGRSAETFILTQSRSSAVVER